jgi:hypothetical protein
MSTMHEGIRAKISAGIDAIWRKIIELMRTSNTDMKILR